MLTVRQELKRFERKGFGLAMELRTGRGDRRLYKREKLLAEVEPIFTLIAYRRVAKFQDNQTKRTDNSYEDRGHKSRSSGKEFTITRTKLRNRHQLLPILYDIYVFLRNYCVRVLSRIAIDILQCFPANCLYGGRNRL